MGRPREHDDATARALLAAGERIAEEEGLEALSVRRVAGTARTTTRAVYSLFGSMEGLVAALGAHAFDLLGAAVAAVPETADPKADLVAAGLEFRAFTRAHPSLFRIAVQRVAVTPDLVVQFRPNAERAMAHLQRRLHRVAEDRGLGGRSIGDAAAQFHALCEGLAALELRGALLPPDPEPLWRSALTALVNGFATPEPRRRR